MGQLTAGIAHEIRNPLLIIKGSAEMLQKKVKGHSDLIRDIKEEADRVNRTVTELLEYARPLSPEMQSASPELLSRPRLESGGYDWERRREGGSLEE